MMTEKEAASKPDNLLEYIPRINVAWEAVGAEVFLLIPKFQSAFLRKHLLPRMRRPNVRLRLDEYGSCVWRHIDGVRTVYEIALALREKFGEAVEPVFDRLGLFISLLHRNRYLVIEKKRV